MQLTKRLFAILLTLALALGNLPWSAVAAEWGETEPTDETPTQGGISLSAEPTVPVEQPALVESSAPTEDLTATETLIQTPATNATVVDSGTCGVNLAWTLDDAGTLTISGTGAMRDYTYYSSAPWCSNRNIVKTVVVESGVTTIGDEAFYNCTSLTSITIPDSVTTIGSSAFDSCTSLTGITIPDSVTTIGAVAFAACTSLTSITIPDSVTTIGAVAFEDCTSLTSIAIPDSVTTIGAAAFYGCTSLTSITIPDSVTTIGDNAFEDCTSLTSITIPDSVTAIGYRAFYNCTSLTSITILDSVTTIDDYAFSFCTSLTSITIPDSVTTIGSYAFAYCTSLSDIYYAGTETQWQEISVGSGNECLTDSTLHIVSVIASGTCGDNLTWTFDDAGTLTISGTGAMRDYTYSSSAPWYSNRNIVKTVVVESGVTTIGDEAFYGCTSLTSITIPDSVTTIGSYAFSNCTSLTSITIPDSVTTIGDYAFSNCTSLTSIAIPDSVTTIGSYAFRNCTSLTSITIPDSVTTIGDCAFYRCTSLTSITIPDSVTTIGDYAFISCTSLTSITIPSSVITIDDGAFSSCTSLTSITIPDSVTAIGNHAFYFCTSLTSIIIPDSVTTIGSLAFRDCTSLTSITIPDSVTTIGDEAFYSCTSLTSIAIPSSITAIGACAFSFCDSLTEVYYAGTEDQWQEISIDVGNEYLSNATIHYFWVHEHTIVTYNEKVPTCTENGWNAYETCATCDYTTYAEIPATGHSYTSNITAPTCTADGYTTHTCGNCGDSYTDSPVAALGHNYVIGTCDRCGDELAVTSIAVKTTPTKTEYLVGERLDTTGLTLTVTYANGSTQTINSGFTVTGFDSNTAGEQTLTVNYAGCTATFTVTVKSDAVPEEAFQIVLESKQAGKGTTFTVAVYLKNNPGIGYLEMTPVIPAGFTVVKVENGNLISDLTKGKQYVWVAESDVTEDGLLMTFTFSIDETVGIGTYPVSFIVRFCSNYQEETYQPAVIPGNIEIVDFVYGDVNGDGTLNGMDVLRLTGYFADMDYETGESAVTIFPGADANGDGQINGMDILRLKRYFADLDYETGESTVILGPQQ